MKSIRCLSLLAFVSDPIQEVGHTNDRDAFVTGDFDLLSLGEYASADT